VGLLVVVGVCDTIGCGMLEIVVDTLGVGDTEGIQFTPPIHSKDGATLTAFATGVTFNMSITNKAIPQPFNDIQCFFFIGNIFGYLIVFYIYIM
jgi:hypothetical protein